MQWSKFFTNNSSEKKLDKFTQRQLWWTNCSDTFVKRRPNQELSQGILSKLGKYTYNSATLSQAKRYSVVEVSCFRNRKFEESALVLKKNSSGILSGNFHQFISVLNWAQVIIWRFRSRVQFWNFIYSPRHTHTHTHTHTHKSTKAQKLT